ncbi:potassium channel family protein [Cryobacterium sp. RTC2.1]|uniref:potassium channel family protein n=1 Tax=Cryobacterium sp. RTC2.1 TaxID=3048634 RepID=UPI002B2290C9|nr:potassium channel family protein [Cryobacterium sp. RTC2.1]MEB0003617.1 potassium channel family protein [Cryobacterium sp. RTC2.1]
MLVLPVLRSLRLLRLVTGLSAFPRSPGTAMRSRVGIYVTPATVLLVFLASLSVLDAERHAPGANIASFGNALWWTFVTIATVGYGDFTPVTIEGRLVTVAIMLGGIALIGAVTATVASWVVDRVADLTRDQGADK